MSWYHIPGSEQDTVISTRVRLARNLTDFPFTSRLDAARARELVGRVGEVLEKNGFSRVDFADISRTAAQSLVEKHYASPAFVRESLPHALFLNEPCNLSVMVCEEDHIRLQCILPGLSLHDAYAGACKVEALLDSAFSLAFDQHFGYLTACPTNLGTAMRASVMLCLPMLSMGRRPEALSLQLGQTGLIMRGLYGEGTAAVGGLYQISNRATLGLTEEDILDRLARAAEQITATERHLRESVSGAELDKLTDRVCRAEGILRYAHSLTSAELIALLSDARLGAAMGILTGIRVEAMTALLVEAMPATLTLAQTNPPRSDHERDVLRARLVKERLFGE
jgi:protein arginine kinase